ncbi:MAG: cation:proton antiporter [bacterium]|nr:cation:proton antiporter [bacterium]
MLESLFFEIGAIIVLAGVLSFIAHALRQPLILAYIITGMLAGPGIFNLARSPETFEALSQVGIAFLLFTVGLGLNWKRMRDVGGVALATGVGQVIFTSAIGYLIATAFGFDVVTSIFLSVAFAFSSTIIIVKLLMDKDDLDSLYGRISLGFLLVQDFVAMILLLVLGAMQSGDSLTTILAVSLTKGIIAVAFLVAVSLWLIPHIVRYAARSQELLLIFALAWCFLVAGILTSAGFGIEIGALIAGIMLSGTVFQREIIARVRHLRDFFLIIFFIVLGTGLELSSLDDLLLPTIIFSLFILVGNPLIVMLIMRGLRHHPRTGFLAGTTVAQISEFSFIVIGVGVGLGMIPHEAFVLTAAVGIVTIAGSSYLIQHNHKIYNYLRPLFKWLEPKSGVRKQRPIEPAEVVLLGYQRMGRVLLPQLQKFNKTVAVVDYDPIMIEALRETKVTAIYGDASDEDFLSEIQVHDAKLIVSTIPDLSVTTSLLEYLKESGHKGIVVVTSKHEDDAESAYAMGASFVIVAPVLGGEKFAEILHQRKLIKKRWKPPEPLVIGLK